VPCLEYLRTLDTYSRVTAGMQQDAADTVASMMHPKPAVSTPAKTHEPQVCDLRLCSVGGGT
jgi:hypothetical protein